jgi:ribosomal protein L40E
LEGIKMAKWEYKTVYAKTLTNDKGIEPMLNRLGAEGWELVSVIWQTGHLTTTMPHLYILKRQLKTKTCSRCKAETPYDSEFCVKCGARLNF